MLLQNKTKFIIKVKTKINPKSSDVISDRIEFVFCENSEMKQRMIERGSVIIVNETRNGLQI